MTVHIHPTALVETKSIGSSTQIWAFTHVMKDVSIGTNCNIGGHCFIESGAVIGNNVTVKNGTMIWEGVALEEGVFVGPRVSFTNDHYPRSRRLPQAKKRYNNNKWLLRTVVKEGATIGAGAVLLPGLTIGEFSMIGAGAVVTRDVPPYALVVGNPAHIKDWVCQCGQPLKFWRKTTTCSECQKSFVQDETVLRPIDEALISGSVLDMDIEEAKVLKSLRIRSVVSRSEALPDK
jgi:UDP-2-acetamido-3-amino-2,3-dideoxy-glucuronate N-acetyltransferase